MTRGCGHSDSRASVFCEYRISRGDAAVSLLLTRSQHKKGKHCDGISHNRGGRSLALRRAVSRSRLASRPKPRLRDSSAPNGPVASIENLGIPICSHLEALEVEADADHVEGIVVHQPTGNVLKISRPSAQIWPAGSAPETAAPEHGQSTPQAAPSYGQPVVNRPRWALGARLWPGRTGLAFGRGSRLPRLSSKLVSSWRTSST